MQNTPKESEAKNTQEEDEESPYEIYGMMAMLVVFALVIWFITPA